MTPLLRVEPAYRAGSGPPLVLLHGITASWRIWSPVLDALARHHRVYAPSLPGHAGAAALAPDVRVSIATLADVVEAQLDEEGIETAHVVGNSFGGWLALELAARGRARTVVAISPLGGWATARDRDRVVRMFRGYAAVTARVGELLAAPMARPRWRRLALRSVMEHGERVPARLATEQVREGMACVVLPAVADWLATQEAVRRTEPFGVPVRIAWPLRDRTLPFEEHGRPLVAALPGAGLVRLPGVGHVPMYDDPGLVVRTILEVTRRSMLGVVPNGAGPGRDVASRR